MRILSLVLATFPVSTFAEIYTAPSQPTAVTVYSGFAMVTRTVEIEMGEGAHELVLPDLPQWVDGSSLRVSVAGAQLGSTRLRTDALAPQPNRDSPEVRAAQDRIDTAKRALRDLDDRAQDAGLAAQAAKARLAFLEGLSASETLPSDPQELAELAQMIETQTLAATQAQIRAERAAREIEEGRDDLVQEVSDAQAAFSALTPPLAPRSSLALSLAAPEAGPVTASISYPVSASWQPTYDVMLDRGDTDRLIVRRAALITQSSGENWDNVSLTLSTLSPSGQVRPSEVYPPLLRFEDPLETQKLSVRRSALNEGVASAAAPESVMFDPVTAQPNFDGPGVTYTLPNLLTVARNAEDARIELDALAFDARVFARAVPAHDTVAYMMAEATNTTAEPLLAARNAQIFVDGALVGQTPFSAVPAGGQIMQAFGPVEEVRLTRTVLDRSAGDRGLLNKSNAQTQQTQISVENLGSNTWAIELREAVPYSEQDDLKIEWAATPPADQRDVEGRRGLLQWSFSLAGEGKKDITIDQTIRWPDGMVLR